MLGSEKKLTEREKILEAMQTSPLGGYFIWDGIDEDDRPATKDELLVGIELADKQLCLDSDILAAFRATGTDWQMRINTILREWLKVHPVLGDF